MDKIKMPEFDKEQVDKFISDVASLYPKHNVNINNVNDFALMFEEKRNCARCRGLAYCKNNNVGFCLSCNDKDLFSFEACRYKKEDDKKRNSLIKTLYLPDEVLEAKLENFDVKGSDSREKIYKHIVEYGQDKDFEKGLYLYGSFAVGKTYALAVIANELAKKGIESLLIYFPDLVLDLKSALGSSRFEELINMIKDIDVLMLDDLGSENMTPWLRDEILGPVINYRMMAKKPLYISSNLNPKDLQNHFSIDDTKPSNLKAERILSRMTSLSVSLNMNDSKSYKR